jgi:hypothetical protein
LESRFLCLVFEATLRIVGYPSSDRFHLLCRRLRLGPVSFEVCTSAWSEDLMGCDREGRRTGDEKHDDAEHEGMADHPVADTGDRWFSRASQSS